MAGIKSLHATRRTIARVTAGKLLASDAQTVAKRKHIMNSLAAYLVENNMTEELDVIINDIAEELYAQSGLLTVEVTTARKLTAESRKALQDYLKDVSKAKTVVLHETIDEKLIGGFIAKTPTAELDASIQYKLRQLTAMV